MNTPRFAFPCLPLLCLVSFFFLLLTGAPLLAQRTYTAPWVDTANAPTLDGVVSPGEWDAATASGDFKVLRTPSPGTVSTETVSVRVLWTDDALYLLVTSDYGSWNGPLGPVNFGQDNLNILFDPNLDGEANTNADGQDSFLLAASQPPGGPFTQANTPVFSNAHVNGNFGNPGGSSPAGITLGQINGAGGGVFEMCIPWTAFNAPSAPAAEGLSHPMAPANGNCWFFNVGRISSGSPQLPIWNYQTGQFFAERPMGQLKFAGQPMPDTDNDGIPDAFEQQIIDADGSDAVDGLEDVDETTDFDGDGLLDKDESTAMTNPTNGDTDGDGLSDGEEVSGSANGDYGNAPTDPLDPDSDDDLLTDGEETSNDTNPNDADTDGDGSDDFLEKSFTTGPTDPNETPDTHRIADSSAEFSGVQGQDGWINGYRNVDQDGGSNNYDPMLAFNPFAGGAGMGAWDGTTQQWTGTAWDLNTAPAAPWTVIGAEDTHPNGINSGDEHWTIRRWVAEGFGSTSTPLALTYTASMADPAGGGVTVSLHINGVMVDFVVLDGDDGIGTIRRVYANLKDGDDVDLALSPTGPVDNNDSHDLTSNRVVVDTNIPVNPTQPDGTPFIPAGGADTDGDGWSDYEEGLRGTDPSHPDTDRDGVWDSVDVDPLSEDSDSDGDGLTDLEESGPFGLVELWTFQEATPVLEIPTVPDEYTVMAYVKRETDEWGELVERGPSDDAPPSHGDYLLGVNEDGFVELLNRTVFGEWQQFVGNTPIPLGESEKIAITVDNELTIDVNGTEDISIVVDGSTEGGNDNPLRIVQGDDSNPNSVVVEWVALYDYLLESDELTALGVEAPDPGTGTDPLKSDTDGDGLDDGVEVNTHGTNPLKPDSDFDGQSDRDEVTLGFDPRDPWRSFMITNLSLNPDGTMALTFQSVRGKLYTVEFNEGLHVSGWTEVGDITAEGPTTTLPVPNASGNDQVFFRVGTGE